jgi:hypothetical protein
MTRQQITIVSDDMTGEEGAEAVTFALDGIAYQIDLIAANHSKLTAALAPFISCARRIGKYGASPFPTTVATVRGAKGVTVHKEGRNDPAYVGRVKAWAAENGHHVASRGRVPKTVIEAYTAAGGK